jgi:hypothetical protein
MMTGNFCCFVVTYVTVVMTWWMKIRECTVIYKYGQKTAANAYYYNLSVRYPVVFFVRQKWTQTRRSNRLQPNSQCRESDEDSPLQFDITEREVNPGDRTKQILAKIRVVWKKISTAHRQYRILNSKESSNKPHKFQKVLKRFSKMLCSSRNFNQYIM